MNVPPQTVYQQLRVFFPALNRAQHIIAQYTDPLSIWLRESADGNRIESLGIDFALPDQPPLPLFQTIRGWFDPQLPPIEELIDELTHGGRARPFSSRSKPIGDWTITVAVFPQSRTVRLDRVQQPAAA
jgi:hypothetical protein